MCAVRRVLAGGISRFGRRIFSTYRSQASAKAKPTSVCRYMPVYVLWDESFLDLHPTPSYRDFPESVGFESFCLNIFGLLLAVCFQVVSPASVGGYCPLNFVVKHRSEAAPGSLRLLSVVL